MNESLSEDRKENFWPFIGVTTRKFFVPDEVVKITASKVTRSSGYHG